MGTTPEKVKVLDADVYVIVIVLSEQNYTHFNVSPVAGSVGSPTIVGIYNVKYPFIGISPIV